MGVHALSPDRIPRAAVGVVCLRGEEVLLVRRGKAPRAGEWSIPGGRIEWGESAAEAAARELREETGVEAEFHGLLDVVDGFFPDRGAAEAHFVLIDFLALWRAGEPVPGDDALEARFVRRDQLAGFALWGETARIIELAFERKDRGP